MAVSVMAQSSMGVGKWTSAAKHGLGFTWLDPIENKTYTYVQFTKGSGVDGFEGSPCGIDAATAADGTLKVTCDQSASVNLQVVGVIRNVTGSAVTDTYYGWMQIAVPFQVLNSVICSSGVAYGERMVWSADAVCDGGPAFTSVIEKLFTPVGIVLSGCADSGNAFVSTAGTADVLVLLHPCEIS